MVRTIGLGIAGSEARRFEADTGFTLLKSRLKA